MRYTKIDAAIWADDKFISLSKLNPSGQALWFYLLTNPYSPSIPGLIHQGQMAMAEHLGWPVEAFAKAFAEVFAKGLAEANAEARVVWVPNALKFNPPGNPNIIKHWAYEFTHIPQCDLKDKALQALKDYVLSRETGDSKWIRAIDEYFGKALPKALAKPFGKPLPKPSPNTKANSKTKTKTNTSGSGLIKLAQPPPPKNELIDKETEIELEETYREENIFTGPKRPNNDFVSKETLEPPGCNRTGSPTIDDLPVMRSLTPEQQNRVRELVLSFSFRRYGTLPNLSLQVIQRAAEEFAVTIEAFGDEAFERWQTYFKEPPKGHLRDMAAWQIRIYLGLDAQKFQSAYKPLTGDQGGDRKKRLMEKLQELRRAEQ